MVLHKSLFVQWCNISIIAMELTSIAHDDCIGVRPETAWNLLHTSLIRTEACQGLAVAVVSPSREQDGGSTYLSGRLVTKLEQLD